MFSSLSIRSDWPDGLNRAGEAWMPRQAPGGFLPGAWPPAPAGMPDVESAVRLRALARLVDVIQCVYQIFRS